MEFEDQIELEHLFFLDRKCRSCGKIKNLIDDYYITRKDRTTLASSYSYECKECTINRIIKNREKSKNDGINWIYPDW
jgi:hypothetical protein